MTVIVEIKNPEELNILKDKTAEYDMLHFEFSEKYLNELKELLTEKHAYQLFAKEQEVFVGYIAAAEKELKQNFLWIVELFVEPMSSGRGVGTSLIQEVIQKAKEFNLEGIITQTEFENIPAQRLYEKNGFVQVENLDWKEGVTYELSLKTV